MYLNILAHTQAGEAGMAINQKIYARLKVINNFKFINYMPPKWNQKVIYWMTEPQKAQPWKITGRIYKISVKSGYYSISF